MISLSQIEAEIMSALKAKDQLLTDTLRGLKVRIQNQQIAKMSPLTEDEILALVKSEVKRRKEAAESYSKGSRQELADKELLEAKILEKYLPAQVPETELAAIIEKIIAAENAKAADFGKVMGKLKAQLGNSADGAVLARLLKERLK